MPTNTNCTRKELGHIKTSGMVLLWCGIWSQICAGTLSFFHWYRLLQIFLLFLGLTFSFLSGFAFHLWVNECDKVKYAEAKKAQEV